MDLKNASDSAWCASRPRVGSGTPGQNTAVSAECRLRKTSQSCAFHESSSVFIRCRLSSPLILPPPPCRLADSLTICTYECRAISDLGRHGRGPRNANVQFALYGSQRVPPDLRKPLALAPVLRRGVASRGGIQALSPARLFDDSTCAA